mmetsp:Transcript_57702/g.153803  ORF Transcript_57702/g.153803 Transcript_57702/m.153803 type:complete len:279 (+) Transcript_57702:1752-2588(+)
MHLEVDDAQDEREKGQQRELPNEREVEEEVPRQRCCDPLPCRTGKTRSETKISNVAQVTTNHRKRQHLHVSAHVQLPNNDDTDSNNSGRDGVLPETRRDNLSVGEQRRSNSRLWVAPSNDVPSHRCQEDESHILHLPNGERQIGLGREGQLGHATAQEEELHQQWHRGHKSGTDKNDACVRHRCWDTHDPVNDAVDETHKQILLRACDRRSLCFLKGKLVNCCRRYAVTEFLTCGQKRIVEFALTRGSIHRRTEWRHSPAKTAATVRRLCRRSESSQW